LGEYNLTITFFQLPWKIQLPNANANHEGGLLKMNKYLLGIKDTE